MSQDSIIHRMKAAATAARNVPDGGDYDTEELEHLRHLRDLVDEYTDDVLAQHKEAIAPELDTGEFDDEFPDEHSHVPQEIAPGTLGLHFCDEEGRHYYLDHKVTNEGVIIDVYDRYGEELQATWAKTWEELGQWVQNNYPTPEFSDR